MGGSIGREKFIKEIAFPGTKEPSKITSFEDVVKTSIFISDMTNFSEINAIYATYFNEETAPARETVEVANLPKFVNVEISMIAVK